MASNTYTATQTPAFPLRRLWFGIAAAPVAWLVHGALSFFISWQACQDGDANWGFLSGLEVRVLLGVLAFAMLAIAVFAGTVAASNLVKVSKVRNRTDEDVLGRERFMAGGGVFVSTIFALGIVLGGMGPLLVGVCETAR